MKILAALATFPGRMLVRATLGSAFLASTSGNMAVAGFVLSFIMVIAFLAVGMRIGWGILEGVAPVKGDTADFNASYTATSEGVATGYDLFGLFPLVLAAGAIIVALVSAFAFFRAR